MAQLSKSSLFFYSPKLFYAFCVLSKSSAHVAQSVERVLGKDEVTGSSPVAGSNIKKKRLPE